MAASTPQRSAIPEGIYRRVTWRLIPFLIVCYTFSIIDRLNIAMAKLQMLPDLGFSDAVYGLGAGLFFIGYLLFDVPSNVILHRVGARWWIGRIMVSWGVISAAMGFVTSPYWFYLLRFLLGVAEAGFFAGLVLYITYWYPPQRRGKIFAALLLAAPLAGLIGNPLGGWILSNLNHVWGIAGWNWLFPAGDGIEDGEFCLLNRRDSIMDREPRPPRGRSRTAGTIPPGPQVRSWWCA